MGAPGFMSYWLGLAVFLLEYTSHVAPRHPARARCWSLQVDLALIMLSAGVYKVDGRVSAEPRHGARAVQPDVGLLVAAVRDASAESLVSGR